MDSGSPRRPQRQDTFDLRGTMITDDQSQIQIHSETYPSDEEHSMLEDDSDQDERDGDYADDDDRSSSLSIPNESIDFDLVYSLHSFAATVEGQASVVKGDSLVLMDDSNSYWWLVRVLKTQEIGYIPAENIETPFERLARLNKHRNVDVCPLLCRLYFTLKPVTIARFGYASGDAGGRPHCPYYGLACRFQSADPIPYVRQCWFPLTATCTALCYIYTCTAGPPLSSRRVGRR